MNVPEDLAALLRPRIRTGPEVREQVFPFLTVDVHAFPHVTLLSRAELGVSDGDGAVLAVIGGTGARANLRRSRTATLVAVGGTVVHSAKVIARLLREEDGLLGAVLTVEHHKRDSLGIEIAPMAFPSTNEVAHLEHWDRHARVLAALAREAGDA